MITPMKAIAISTNRVGTPAPMISGRKTSSQLALMMPVSLRISSRLVRAAPIYPVGRLKLICLVLVLFDKLSLCVANGALGALLGELTLGVADGLGGRAGSLLRLIR